MHGKLTSVKPAALQKKRENRNAVALDSEQNPVQKEDVVKVSKSSSLHWGLLCSRRLNVFAHRRSSTGLTLEDKVRFDTSSETSLSSIRG